MRIFWTIFFLGSMLLVGVDTYERRQVPESPASSDISVSGATMETDPFAAPTPRP